MTPRNFPLRMALAILLTAGAVAAFVVRAAYAAATPRSPAAKARSLHDLRKWDQVIRQEIGNLPGGFAFAVIENGKIVDNGVEGFARAPKEKTDPSLRWTLDQPMGLASVSKFITALAVMRVLEQENAAGNKITVDTPFWGLIKRVVPAANEDDKKITIRQLLRHRSGFPHSDAIGDVNSPATLEKLMRTPLAHKPGEAENYDNNNYYALRLVIEELSHYSYTGYVKKEVLQPMGITDMETHYFHDHSTLAYDAKNKKPGFVFDWDLTETAGAAGWYGSVDDLARLLIGFRNHSVLSEESVKAVFDNNFGLDADHPWGKNGGWGWETDDVAGTLESAILLGDDGVDGALLINCNTQKDVLAILADAWKESRTAK